MKLLDWYFGFGETRTELINRSGALAVILLVLIFLVGKDIIFDNYWVGVLLGTVNAPIFSRLGTLIFRKDRYKK